MNDLPFGAPAADPLRSFARNVTSQGGEDGILAEILLRIGSGSRWCAELGAWDGKRLSNTYSLWHDQGWAAVLIEGSPKRYEDLRAATGAWPQVIPVCQFAGWEGENALENILLAAGAPVDLDVLSVDIDSNDYYLFRSLSRLRPRILVIEYNPTIPPHLDVVQPAGGKPRLGASARALVRLAHEKGYTLASCTSTNLIFIRQEDFTRMGFGEPRLEDVFNPGHLTYLIASMDGRYFLSAPPPFGEIRLPFHKRVERLFRSLLRRPGLPGLERVECYSVRQ